MSIFKGKGLERREVKQNLPEKIFYERNRFGYDKEDFDISLIADEVAMIDNDGTKKFVTRSFGKIVLIKFLMRLSKASKTTIQNIVRRRKK